MKQDIPSKLAKARVEYRVGEERSYYETLESTACRGTFDYLGTFLWGGNYHVDSFVDSFGRTPSLQDTFYRLWDGAFFHTLNEFLVDNPQYAERVVSDIIPDSFEVREPGSKQLLADFLVKHRESRRYNERLIILHLLVILGTERSYNALVGLFPGCEVEKQRDLAASFAEAPAPVPSAVKLADMLAGSVDPSLRIFAARALVGLYGEFPAVHESLKGLLLDSDGRVALNALAAISETGDAGRFRLLIEEAVASSEETETCAAIVLSASLSCERGFATQVAEKAYTSRLPRMKGAGALALYVLGHEGERREAIDYLGSGTTAAWVLKAVPPDLMTERRVLKGLSNALSSVEDATLQRLMLENILCLTGDAAVPTGLMEDMGRIVESLQKESFAGSLENTMPAMRQDGDMPGFARSWAWIRLILSEEDDERSSERWRGSTRAVAATDPHFYAAAVALIHAERTRIMRARRRYAEAKEIENTPGIIETVAEHLPFVSSVDAIAMRRLERGRALADAAYRDRGAVLFRGVARIVASLEEIDSRAAAPLLKEVEGFLTDAGGTGLLVSEGVEILASIGGKQAFLVLEDLFNQGGFGLQGTILSSFEARAADGREVPKSFYHATIGRREWAHWAQKAPWLMQNQKWSKEAFQQLKQEIERAADAGPTRWAYWMENGPVDKVPGGVEFLASLLEGEGEGGQASRGAQLAAARGLARVGDARGVDFLLKMLKEGEQESVHNVPVAVWAEMTTPENFPSVLALLRKMDGTDRVAWFEILKGIVAGCQHNLLRLGVDIYGPSTYSKQLNHQESQLLHSGVSSAKQ